jgi:hypothetical protein
MTAVYFPSIPCRLASIGFAERIRIIKQCLGQYDWLYLLAASTRLRLNALANLTPADFDTADSRRNDVPPICFGVMSKLLGLH